MKDKVVIITGGTSGIGRALAFEFGMHGSKIVITGRNEDALHATLNDLGARNIEAWGVLADVTRLEDNMRMAEEAVKKFGRIDVLINNAGISMRAVFEEVDPAVLEKVMDINFFGAVYATRCCISEIIRNKGSVIGISSIAGFRGLPARTGYSASKFALNGFLESLRTELCLSGIHSVKHPQALAHLGWVIAGRIAARRGENDVRGGMRRTHLSRDSKSQTHLDIDDAR
jgi:NAD(P)-dependent dehydrogenase (short-subunit alcohol dehydrogenase family)